MVARCFLISVSLITLSGCAPRLFEKSHFEFSTEEYDSQGCVEDALRRHPDTALTAAAASDLEPACAAGEAASCSALGVLAETGQGVPRDLARAARLYASACGDGNARACVNLSRLQLSGMVAVSDHVTARARLLSACNDGEVTGCEELGKHLAHRSQRGSPERRLARALLDRACTRQRGEACYELALIDAPPGAPPSAWTLELFAKACVAGHAAACERLDAKRAVAETKFNIGPDAGL